MYSRKDLTKTTLAAAVVLALGTGSAYSAVTDTGITGNNFTMIAGGGTLQGGTNDVTFTWDGTFKTAVVTDGSNNATLSSPTPFAAGVWTAHRINIYGPGTYTFNTGCPAGNPSCTTASTAKKYELVVPTGYIGAHMLFNWSTSSNIDVVNLWKMNDSWDASGGELGTGGTSTDPFCATPFTNGSCNTVPNPNGNTRNTVWNMVSVDTPASTVRLSDGSVPTAQPNEDNLYHGTKMIDGPFQGSSANFNVKLDATPDAFTFTDQTGVATSSTITSAAITVAKSGGTAIFQISVSGGTYSTDGGTTYTSNTGVVSTGQTVRARHTSASGACASTNTTVTIGGVSDVFTSTTAGACVSDTSVDPFTFSDRTGVALSTVIESNEITVDGINTTVDISISGGEYSVNGGTYTSASGTGTINNGDKIKVRHTSAGTNSTSTNTTLTIGSSGTNDVFTSTTLAATTAAPDAADPNMPSGCSISTKSSSVVERGDWWVMAGFLVWLGALRKRFKHQAQS